MHQGSEQKMKNNFLREVIAHLDECCVVGSAACGAGSASGCVS